MRKPNAVLPANKQVLMAFMSQLILSVCYQHDWKVFVMYRDKTQPIRVPVAAIVSRDGFLLARFEEERKQRCEN